MSSLLYRISQRIKYRKAQSHTERRIIELNMQRPRVIDEGHQWYVPEADARFPKHELDNLFDWFDLLIQLPKRLNGKYLNENNKLYFQFGELKIKVNSFSELYIINEIYYQQCYRFRTHPDDRLVVMDMGMNVGLASLYFAQHEQVEHIYAYEPFGPTYQQALENLSHAPAYASKINPLQFGLGKENRSISVPYNAGNSGTNVTLLEQTPKEQTGESIRLVIRNAREELDRLLDLHPQHKVLIKLDTEGAEYEIFDALFARKLPDNLIGFLMEWHVKGPEPLEKNLVNEGFRLVSTVIEPNTGLIYAFR